MSDRRQPPPVVLITGCSSPQGIRLVASASPGLAEQSGPAARAYVAGALLDPSRERELRPLLAAFQRSWTSGSR